MPIVETVTFAIPTKDVGEYKIIAALNLSGLKMTEKRKRDLRDMIRLAITNFIPKTEVFNRMDVPECFNIDGDIG